jgi:hypothetical protein
MEKEYPFPITLFVKMGKIVLSNAKAPGDKEVLY